MADPDSTRRLVAFGDSSLAIELAYLEQLLGDRGRAELRAGDAALPGLNRLAERHRLTAFDRDVLLLAASPHLDRKYVRHFERVDGDVRPSVGLVLSLLGDAAGLSRDLVMTRLSRGAPLVANGLVTIDGDRPFAARRLIVPDVVWQRMLGIAEPEAGVLAPMPVAELVASDAVRAQIATTAAQIDHRSGVVAIVGPSETGRTTLARAIATCGGHRLVRMAPRATVAEIVREARWSDAIPLLARPDVALDELLVDCPVVMFELEPGELTAEVALRAIQLRTARLDRGTRAGLWRRALGTASALDLGAIVDAYPLGPARIETAVEQAEATARARGSAIEQADVIAACRSVAPMQSLRSARRLDATMALADLVLPTATRLELELAIAWSRHRAAIRESSHGPHLAMASGLTCLFSGPSGTGKTTAACAVAREIGLPIHRVDLSQVMDKYIGETEKHLGRMFDEAEAASVILFFDEADALFAKRTEVRDAHDRFANVETGYLLQRIEEHPGIVILASNLRRNFDEAFARRIQIIVDFPVPGVAERKELWRRMVPPPHEGLDLALLATRFPFSGGDIRNAVIASLVLARAEGCALAMRHLIVATWREMQRSGRLGTGGEFAGWQKELAPWLPEQSADPRRS